MRRRLLFLCHRIPYPPDKGDKIRAWHMLAHLARGWDVDLGCLVDDPADLVHLPHLQSVCAEVLCVPTGGRVRAGLRAVLQMRPGLPLTLGWFHAPRLRDWAARGLAAGRYDAVFVYSAAMAPYALQDSGHASPIRILDLVDVDSEKWRAYAVGARAPMRQVWLREARTLLGFEARMAATFDRTLLVSRPEVQRLSDLAPEVAGRLDFVENGVDLGYFDPALGHADPYAGDPAAIVFTGAMDYRPNVEAVVWFASKVLPVLRAGDGRRPSFWIVGAKPAPAVRSLAALPGVHVTGRVADTRPYLAHAAAAVAPLTIARGIQNKVLEAMAMGRPVVASTPAFEGVRARPGQDLLVADGQAETVDALSRVLAGDHPGLGTAARAAMRRAHDWSATLRRLDAVLARPIRQDAA